MDRQILESGPRVLDRTDRAIRDPAAGIFTGVQLFDHVDLAKTFPEIR